MAFPKKPIFQPTFSSPLTMASLQQQANQYMTPPNQMGAGSMGMLTTPFQVGQRVRIIDGYGFSHQFPVGLEVTINQIEPYRGDLYCSSDTGLTQNVRLQYVEALEPMEAKKKPGAAPKISMDSVIINEEKKEDIRAAISQVENSDLIFSEWGFDEVFEKGTAVTLLFWGIPGTGKTLMAQAIADELGADLKIYGTAEIESQEPGGPERMIKSIFAEAKKLFTSKTKIPRVILFDECDSLLMDRNEVGPVLSGQINTLLGEIERHQGVVIFTTNRLGKLDPALERRVSAKIEFEFPTKEQRLAIWKRLIPAKAPLSKNVDFKKLADYPLAGGNIKNAVLNAARMAAYKKADKIDFNCFKKAIESEIESLQAFASEYEKQNHSSVVGYTQRTSGGLIIDKKATIQKQTTIEPKYFTLKKEGKDGGS